MKNKKNYILKYFFKENRWWLILSLLGMPLSNMCRVSASMYVGQIMNFMKNPTNLKQFITIILSASFIMAMYYVTRILLQILGKYLTEKLAVKTRLDLYEHLTKVPFIQYEKFSIGNLQSIYRNDISLAANVVGYGLESVEAISLFILTAIYMFSIHFNVALIVCLTCVLAGIFNNYLLHYFKFFRKAEREAVGELTGLIESTCNGMDTVKTSNSLQYIISFFVQNKHKYNKNVVNSEIVDTIRDSSYILINNVCIFGVMIYLGYLGIKGQLDIGSILVFITLTRDIMMPINVVFMYIPKLVTCNVAWERILGVLKIRHDENVSERENEYQYDDVSTVEWRDITYAYGNKEKVFDGYNLILRKGKSHLLVGESGSGKSTLLKILAGLYRTDQSVVLVNGTLANQAKLYNSIVFVSCDSPLFNMSIYDNLTLGEQRISREQCIELADDLGVAEWINSLPDGLDTLIRENGNSISGGQRQILIIMRAILTEARIVILDEPTSALDMMKEEKFKRLIDYIKRHRIVLLTSHRQGMINFCDSVFQISTEKITR